MGKGAKRRAHAPRADVVSLCENESCTMKVKVRKVGDAYGVVVSKQMLAAVGLKSGDPVTIVHRDGKLFVAPLHRGQRRKDRRQRVR